MTNSGALHPSWQAVIGDEFNKPYMQSLRQFLAQQKAEDKVIYPPMPLIFNAFNHTPFEQVRVVIIGQDPYHGEGQAHGLSFSVRSEEHTSELQSRPHLVCRLLLEKKNK